MEIVRGQGGIDLLHFDSYAVKNISGEYVRKDLFLPLSELLACTSSGSCLLNEVRGKVLAAVKEESRCTVAPSLEVLGVLR